MEKSTIIGIFSETWDTERAMEDLNYAGFEGRIRLVENDTAGHPDNSKQKGGVNSFFARLFGFDDEEEYLDARGNWSVSPEAEQFFFDQYHRRYHVILVLALGDKAKAISILQHHNARVEEQQSTFFGFQVPRHKIQMHFDHSSSSFGNY